ncbi:MAG: hypothetical protein LBR52_00460 [Prevotellaceae bacterium]|jgi:predicted transposase YdaD|nr:hypothetical protein [Prevotellaceae bacterium]
MQKNDYLWKGILEDIFDDFLRFMHPEAGEIFNFGRKIQFLDKELEQLFPPGEDEFSVKIVDKLAKVYTREGKEKWILIHCEVQGKYKPDFPHRMFTYFSRIFNKYGKRISAYAILTEESTRTRTNKYITEFLGTRLEYHYNVYKISQQSEEELSQSENPFAMVVLTARSILKKKQLDDDALMEIKLKLARRLFEKSFEKERVRKIMTFLNSYIHFENKENNIIFEHHLDRIKGRITTMGIEELVLRAREHEGIKIGEERGLKRGMEHGMERKSREVILNMVQKKFADETIADLLGVSLEYVQKIKEGCV